MPPPSRQVAVATLATLYRSGLLKTGEQALRKPLLTQYSGASKGETSSGEGNLEESKVADT